MIQLPASPGVVLAEVVVPALQLLPTRMDTPAARVLVLAIMIQESGLARRRQLDGGPARGLAQFELLAVEDVLTRSQSAAAARAACALRGIQQPITPQIVYEAIEHDDCLAAALARCLLWLNPAPLPALGDESMAWRYYMHCWRPGRPRPEHWPDNYARALSCVRPIPAGEPRDGP